MQIQYANLKSVAYATSIRHGEMDGLLSTELSRRRMMDLHTIDGMEFFPQVLIFVLHANLKIYVFSNYYKFNTNYQKKLFKKKNKSIDSLFYYILQIII
jgi:hypothetical protein